MEVSSQLHVVAVLSPGKEPEAPSEQQAGLTPNPVLTLWRREKYLVSDGNRPTILRSSSPWPSRNTDYTIAGSFLLRNNINVSDGRL